MYLPLKVLMNSKTWYCQVQLFYFQGEETEAPESWMTCSKFHINQWDSSNRHGGSLTS